jgi:hypothetical protein
MTTTTTTTTGLPWVSSKPEGALRQALEGLSLPRARVQAQVRHVSSPHLLFLVVLEVCAKLGQPLA